MVSLVDEPKLKLILVLPSVGGGGAPRPLQLLSITNVIGLSSKLLSEKSLEPVNSADSP